MTERRADLILRLGAWLLLAALAAAGAQFALTKSMHHDVAYYVNAVARWQDGARPYRDFIDVNLPTIYWLMAIPVWSARAWGLDAMAAFNLFVLLLAAASVAATRHAAARVLRDAAWLPDLLAATLLVWLFLLVGADFGQREHLAAILLAPYAVCRAGAAADRPARSLRLAIGAAAGLGMALKPYFALIVIGVELAVLLRRGWRGWLAAETVALGAAGAVGAAAALLFFPDYHQRVLGLARAIYPAYEWPFVEIVRTMGGRAIACLAMALGALAMAAPRKGRDADLAFLLAAAGLGGYASFFIQSKGTEYQLIPGLVFSCCGFVLAVAAHGRAWLAGPYRPAAAATLSIAAGLALAVTGLDAIRVRGEDAELRARHEPLIRALRAQAQGRPALFLSHNVGYTFPAVDYAGARYPYRWHHLLPMPAAYSGFQPGPDGRLFHTPGQMGEIERSFFESFIEDAVANPPALLLVDRRRPVRPGLSPDLDLFAYFCQSPRFAELMRGYAWFGRFSSYDALAPRSTRTVANPCGGPPPALSDPPSS